MIVQGEQVNEAICGAPGNGVFVLVGAGVLGLGTVITAVRFVPKSAPLGARKRQVPLNVPKVLGAVIVSEMSTAVPGAAAGIGAAPTTNWVPLTKTIAYDESHAQVPLLSTRHVLVKVEPGTTNVPSGMVTSATYCELGVQPVGADAFVGGTAVAELPAGVAVSTEAKVGGGTTVAMTLVPAGPPAVVSVTVIVRPASVNAPELLYARTMRLCVPALVAFHV